MSDLIRSLRHGGQPALVAAKQLLQKKVKLTPAEAAEVKLLLPQLKDLFGAKLSEGLSTMLSGHEVAVPVPAELLKPDLSKVKEGAQLPGRFATDLQLVRPQLVNHPGLTREDKATRLFGFLLPFLERVVTLPPEERAEVAPQLLEHAEQAGFAQLKDLPTGRDGVEVAEHLLEAKTPEELREQAKPLKLDAPTWPETEPRATAEEQPAPHAEQKQPETARDPQRPAAQPQSPARPNAEAPRTEAPRTETKEPTPERAPITAAQQNVTARGEVPAGLQRRDEAREAPPAAEPSRTNKRLGGRMLWNVLHLFRDDGAQGRESAAQRDEMNRLAVGMALALALLTLIAILLFTTQ